MDHRLSAPRHPPNALRSLDRSHHQCPPRSAAEAIERSANGSIARTLNRKTSLLRIVPTACGQAADIAAHMTPPRRRFSSPCHAIMLRCSEIAHRSRRYVTIDSRSDPTSSRCQISRLRIRLRSLMAQAKDILCERAETRLVEPDGIEPTTSCLQSRRSPN
jgi:hypothetical protein